MDFLSEIVIFLGERVINSRATLPNTPQSEELYRKNFYTFRVAFMAFLLIVASIAPVGVMFLGFTAAKFSAVYLGIAVVFAFSTIAVSIFIFPKILLLLKQYTERQAVCETTSVEDDIKYELGIELLLFIFTFIPFAHIIFCSLAIDRAINILEITNSSRLRIRKNSANIAGYAILVFMSNSLVASLILLIQGSTHS
jgi:hypothetical protein